MNVLTTIGLVIALALVLLNIRELLYLHDKQVESARRFGEASWLVAIIERSNWSTTLIGVGLLIVVAVRQFGGPQQWTPLVTTVLVLWLLGIPVLRGIEWRRRDKR